MLVKWAIEGRQKTAKATPAACDDDRHIGSPSIHGLGEKDLRQAAGSPVESETTAHALTAELDRLHFEHDAALKRSSESNGDRATRRIQAEERDTMLRNDKLLSLTGLHDSHRSEDTEPCMPLTEENIEKLVHEQHDENLNAPHNQGSDKDSNVVNQPESTTNSGLTSTAPRPSLRETRFRESEQTIREGATGLVCK
jgi:hypothetical protein